MATKRQITLRFRDEYMKASKKDKGRILDEMCSVLAIGRSTARRRLAEAGRGRPSPPPEERLKRYSEQSRDLLVRVWLMMDLALVLQHSCFGERGGDGVRIDELAALGLEAHALRFAVVM